VAVLATIRFQLVKPDALVDFVEPGNPPSIKMDVRWIVIS
jgi:hypothetical protein